MLGLILKFAPWVSRIVPWWKLIGVGVLLLALAVAGLYIGHLRNVRDGLEIKAQGLAEDLDNAVAINKANVRALEDAEREHAASLAALEKTIDLERKRARAIATIKKEIDHASPDQDGPVAPVLRSALDWLRNPDRSPAGDGSEDRKDEGPGQPLDLRGPSRTADR